MSAQADADAARLAVLRGAVEMLLEPDDVSFTELSVGEICAEAGISRPTFYAYFTDKLDLVRTLAAQTIDELLAVSAPWFERPPQSRAGLQDVMAQMFNAYAPHRKMMAAAAEVASYDSELGDAFNTALEAAAGHVAAHISEGQRAGQVRADINAQSTARWLAWMTERGMRSAFSGATVAPLADVAAMSDIHWFTLYEGVG